MSPCKRNELFLIFVIFLPSLNLSQWHKRLSPSEVHLSSTPRAFIYTGQEHFSLLGTSQFFFFLGHTRVLQAHGSGIFPGFGCKDQVSAAVFGTRGLSSLFVFSKLLLNVLGVLLSSQRNQAGGLNAENWPRVLVSLDVICEGDPPVCPS